jgi:hypothetical protein
MHPVIKQDSRSVFEKPQKVDGLDRHEFGREKLPLGKLRRWL